MEELEILATLKKLFILASKNSFKKAEFLIYGRILFNPLSTCFIICISLSIVSVTTPLTLIKLCFFLVFCLFCSFFYFISIFILSLSILLISVYFFICCKNTSSKKYMTSLSSNVSNLILENISKHLDLASCLMIGKLERYEFISLTILKDIYGFRLIAISNDLMIFETKTPDGLDNFLIIKR